MERDEILNKLHNIDLQISLTVMPSEYALEVNAITKNGTAYYWCGMDDWCAYKFKGISTSKWHDIKRKIATNSLSANDLSETELANILPANTCDCNDFFASLRELPEDCPDELFCYFDGEAAPVFFENESEMAKILEVYLQGSLTHWEDIDTLELKNILDDYEEGLEIPYISFD